MIDTGKLAALKALPEPSAAPPARSFVPPPPRHPESLHADLVAASLAAGIMASGAVGKCTPEIAVAVWREVRAAVVESA